MEFYTSLIFIRFLYIILLAYFIIIYIDFIRMYLITHMSVLSIEVYHVIL